jgi:Immunity protein 26
MPQKYKAGDIFSLQLPTGEYMNGRVILDVKQQCIRPKLLESGSPLGFHNGHVLTEIYKQTFSEQSAVRSDILIPGIWTDSGSLKDGHWKIVGHEAVDPTQIEFPEAFVGYGARTILFLRGELKLPIDMTNEENDQLHIRDTARASGLLGEICLYSLGREDEINDPDLVDVELRSLKHSDLRFNEFRSEAYRRLGEDEDIPYFEMSLKHGYDIRRFYEIDKDKKKQLNSEPSPLEGLDYDESILTCPYCLSIIQDLSNEICATCHEDMSHDAKMQMTVEEYRTEKRISCVHCGKSMLNLTVLCPHCLQWQTPRENAVSTA